VRRKQFFDVFDNLPLNRFGAMIISPHRVNRIKTHYVRKDFRTSMGARRDGCHRDKNSRTERTRRTTSSVRHRRDRFRLKTGCFLSVAQTHYDLKTVDGVQAADKIKRKASTV
jgi:hypothetical protein